MQSSLRVAQVDAVMRQAIKELPHTLVLHLKRFEWDFETETRFKKKDRFDFPLQLDMYRYTVEGLAEAEAASSPSVRAVPPRRTLTALHLCCVCHNMCFERQFSRFDGSEKVSVLSNASSPWTPETEPGSLSQQYPAFIPCTPSCSVMADAGCFAASVAVALYKAAKITCLRTGQCTVGR